MAILGFLLVLLTAWVLFAPSELGGPITYVTTHGNSMEPMFHSGDLAIVREVRDLKVGDIAAYEHDQTHDLVLHRIIAIRDGRYIFKGDHNTWIDTFQPRREAIIGKLWWHQASAGQWLQWLHEPVHGALVMGLVVAMVANGMRGGASSRPSAARSTGCSGAGDVSRLRGLVLLTTQSGTQTVLGGIVMVAVIAVAVAIWSVRMPNVIQGTVPAKFEQRGTFDYSAAVVPGPVYQNSELKTGDPILVSLAPTPNWTFKYAFASDEAHDVSGTIDVQGIISDVNGWHRTQQLTSTVDFRGDAASVTGQVDLRPMMELVQAAGEAMGEAPRYYTIVLLANVHVKGMVDGSAIDHLFHPYYTLRLSPPNTIYVETEETKLLDALGVNDDDNVIPGTDVKRGDESVSDYRADTLAISRVIPNTFHLWRFDLPLQPVRFTALATGSVAGLAVIIVLSMMFLARRATDAELISVRYGSYLVPVGALPAVPIGRAVTVPSFIELVDLAIRFDRPVLWQRDAPEAYAVEENATLYYYMPEEDLDD